MVVVLLTTVFVGVLVYRRIRKRRARKRAIKLAAVDRAVSNPVTVETAEENFPENEVIIIGRESSPPSSPPPYSRPSPHPYEPSGGPRQPTVLEFEYPGTYVRDKPPPYSTTALQVQNS